ncbi:hypothetical protein OH799_22590 [Nocardia sp. NBC_00881]|uniref:hypothetical protein n=1 Tax=Nocardia sp. NBC_00881 TaxID=2975995 RepID=UPI00386E5A9A|nr:hypothetical protein OH799_22590 [Nocardia sp. NBC_00881]
MTSVGASDPDRPRVDPARDAAAVDPEVPPPVALCFTASVAGEVGSVAAVFASESCTAARPAEAPVGAEVVAPPDSERCPAPAAASGLPLAESSLPEPALPEPAVSEAEGPGPVDPSAAVFALPAGPGAGVPVAVDPGAGAFALPVAPDAGAFCPVDPGSVWFTPPAGPAGGVRVELVDPGVGASAWPAGPEAGEFELVVAAAWPLLLSVGPEGVGELVLSTDRGVGEVVLSSGTDEGVFVAPAGPGSVVSEAEPEAGMLGASGGSEAGGFVERAAPVALFAAADPEVVDFVPFRGPADHLPSAPVRSGVLT